MLEKQGRMESKLFIPGQRVDGYEIVRQLRKGGMGEVYLARDVALGRMAAIKVIRPEKLGSPDIVTRFLFESKITAGFNHPHIVTVYGVGEFEGCPFVALEYLRGRTLSERISEGKLTINESMQIALDIVDALAEAHFHGIIHRDLKPGNVIIPPDGRLRVLDFGLAKIIDHNRQSNIEIDSDSTKSAFRDAFHFEDIDHDDTNNEYIKGTAPYMAPEQWVGENLTTAVDIWALGVMLFEMLTGRRPFSGNRDRLLIEVCSEEDAPSVSHFVSDIPPAINLIVSRCLAKKPSLRPTAKHLLVELKGILEKPRDKVIIADRESSPFRGLLEFRKRDGHLFFGRESETAAFIERLHNQAFLPVVGASGAGKSSFIMAGVMSALDSQGGWQFFRTRPGDNPFLSLANCLLGEGARTIVDAKSDSSSLSANVVKSLIGEKTKTLPQDLMAVPALLGSLLRYEANANGKRIFLFIDQFEELFSLVSDVLTRTKFAESLCLAADDILGSVRVVVALRDDFLSHLAEHPGLTDAVSRGVTVIRTPKAELLTKTLLLPVEQYGYRFEDEALVDSMVSEVAGEPAGLPLLQFAAQRLWEARDTRQRVLLRSVYERMGGVEGALADHADCVIEDLGAEGGSIAKAIFLRMITSNRTRRQVTRDDVISGLGDEAEKVIEKLLNARLLVTRRYGKRETASDTGAAPPQTSLELVHESLIVRWDLLRRWLEESGEDIAFKEQVKAASDLWINHGCRDEDLWRGEILAEVKRWRDRFGGPLSAAETQFLDASLNLEERSKRKRRQIRIGAVAAIALLAVVSMVVAVFIARQAQQARMARDLALQRTAQSLISDASSAMLAERFPEARAKLRSAFEIGDFSAARVLWAKLAKDALYFVGNTGALVYNVAFSPDGKTVASSGAEGLIRLWSVETGSPRFIRNTGWENWSLDISDDGKRLVSGDDAGQVHIWNLEDRQKRTFKMHNGIVKYVRFLSGGKTAVSVGYDGVAVRFDPATGRVIWSTISSVDGLQHADLHSGLSLLACGCHQTGDIIIIDLETGNRIHSWKGHEAQSVFVRFDSSGTFLFSTAEDGILKKWEVGSWKLLAENKGSSGETPAVSDDGALLANGIGLTNIGLRNASDLELIKVFRGHRERIIGKDFSPDGKLLATASFDRTMRLWNLSGTAGEPMPSHRQEIVGLAFSPDGQWIASGAWDKKVILWGLKTGESHVLTEHEEAVRQVAFSHDGRLVASAGNDHSVHITDSASQSVLHLLTGHTHMVWGVSFSPDDKTLVSSSMDYIVRLWDVKTGHLLRTLSFEDSLADVHYGRSGKYLFVRTVRSISLVDEKSLTVLREFHPIEQYNISPRIAISPDEKLVASGLRGHDSGMVWDVQTGRPAVFGKGSGPFGTVDFSPDGQILAAGSRDAIYLWNTRTLELMHKITSPVIEIDAVAFSPESRLLAWNTGDSDASVCVWDLEKKIPYWRGSLMFFDPEPILVTYKGLLRLAPKENRQEPFAPIGALPAALQDAISAVYQRAVEGRMNDRSDKLVFFTGDEDVEFWDVTSGARIEIVKVPGVRKAIPLSDGFLTLADGEVSLWSCSPETKFPCSKTVLLETGAAAMDFSGGTIAISTNGGLRLFTSKGKEKAVFESKAGVSAFAINREQAIFGYQDGSIEIHPANRMDGEPEMLITDVSGSRVVSLTADEPSLLAAGYGNGTVALWNRQTGDQMFQTKLHGPVVHLAFHEKRLYAATVLGSHAVEDLRYLSEEYCALLREIWKEVPIVWEDERIVSRPPSEDHDCANGPK